MSTPEDLATDADREAMLDRCAALHLDAPEGGCPGCEDRLPKMLTLPAGGPWRISHVAVGLIHNRRQHSGWATAAKRRGEQYLGCSVCP